VWSLYQSAERTFESIAIKVLQQRYRNKGIATKKQAYSNWCCIVSSATLRNTPMAESKAHARARPCVNVHVFDFDRTLTQEFIPHDDVSAAARPNQLDVSRAPPSAIFHKSAITGFGEFVNRHRHVIVCSFNKGHIVRRTLARILSSSLLERVRFVTSDMFALEPFEIHALAEKDKLCNVKARYISLLVEMHLALSRYSGAHDENAVHVHFYDDDTANLDAVAALKLRQVSVHRITGDQDLAKHLAR
jgi:hypothetical protein